MSKKSVVLFSIMILGGVIFISYLVWYFINSFIQFHIYWIVLIVLGVLFAGAALAEISGYSLRDLLGKKDRQKPKRQFPEKLPPLNDLDEHQIAMLLYIHEIGEENTVTGVVRVQQIQESYDLSYSEIGKICRFLEDEGLIKHFDDTGQRFIITHEGVTTARKLTSPSNTPSEQDPQIVSPPLPLLALKLMDADRTTLTDHLVLHGRTRQKNEFSQQKSIFGIRLENALGGGSAANPKIRIEVHGRNLNPAKAFRFTSTGNASQWRLDPSINDGHYPAVLEFRSGQGLVCYPGDYLDWSGFVLEMVAGGTGQLELSFTIWWDGVITPQKGSLNINVCKPEGDVERCICCECYWKNKDGMFMATNISPKTGWFCHTCRDRECLRYDEHQLGDRGEW